MGFELIGVVTVLAGLAALLGGVEIGCCAFVISMLLGSAAALALPGVGTIQPAHLMLGFLALSALRDPQIIKALTQVFRFGRPGFWLLCTWIYGVGGAYFLPRYFDGRFGVNSISAAQLMQGLVQVPIGPSSGNITQSIYFTADVVCFALFTALAADKSRTRRLTNYFIAYCVANVVFALLDLGTSLTGTSELLDFMRNSTYVIYSDTAVGGMKRIIGSFTEASAFAYATIGIFCFAARLALAEFRPNLCAALAATSVVLILFSTSSTGYVALGPAAAMLYAGSFLRVTRHIATRRDVTFLLLSPLFLGALVLALCLDRDTLNAIRNMLNTLVFDKSMSQSGLDRARFNAQGLQNFIDSFGWGTGIGSVRTSSLITAVLSNLGVIGSMFYALFIGTCLVERAPPQSRRDNGMRSAARCGMIGLVIAACVSGAMIDLGLAFFAFAGLASRQGEVFEGAAAIRRSWTGKVSNGAPAWAGNA